MPTNRVPIRRQPKSKPITPKIVAAYQRARALYDHPKVNDWEEDGGCKSEFYKACIEMERFLGRSIWDEQVMDTIGDDDVNQILSAFLPPSTSRVGSKR